MEKRKSIVWKISGILYVVVAITAFAFSLIKFSTIGFRESSFMTMMFYPAPVLAGVLLLWAGFSMIRGTVSDAIMKFRGILYILLSIGLLVLVTVVLILNIGFSPQEKTMEILFSPFNLIFIIPFLGIYFGISMMKNKFTTLSVISAILMAALLFFAIIQIWIIEIIPFISLPAPK